MPTKEMGVLTKWDDAKGFGFIKPWIGESPEIFIHISEIRKGMPRRPLPGDLAYYQVARDERTGKPRAYDAYFVAAFEIDEKHNFRGGDSRLGSWVFCGAFIIWPMSCSVYLWKTTGNMVPLAAYCIASVITFVMYQRDKRYAQQGSWRISEARLHLAELFGGWPGALVAQRWFRHKTSKSEYQFVFWLIVFFHLTGWVDHLALHGELRNAVGRYVEKIGDDSRR